MKLLLLIAAIAAIWPRASSAELFELSRHGHWVVEYNEPDTIDGLPTCVASVSNGPLYLSIDFQKTGVPNLYIINLLHTWPGEYDPTKIVTRIDENTSWDFNGYAGNSTFQIPVDDPSFMAEVFQGWTLYADLDLDGHFEIWFSLDGAFDAMKAALDCRDMIRDGEPA